MSKNSLKLDHNYLVKDHELNNRELNFKNEVDELTESAAKKLLVNIYRSSKSNLQRLELKKTIKELV